LDTPTWTYQSVFEAYQPPQVQVMGWGAFYPDAVQAQRHVESESVVTPLRQIESWWPIYPDAVSRSVSPATTGIVDPFPQFIAYWWPEYPDAIDRGWSPATSGILDPFPREPAVFIYWWPSWPDFAPGLPPPVTSGAFVAEPIIPFGPWVTYPTGIVWPGPPASTAILDPLPRPQAEVATWWPLYPAWLPVRPVLPGGGILDPFPIPPPPAPELSWSPLYPAWLEHKRWHETRFAVMDPFPRPNLPAPDLAWQPVYPVAVEHRRWHESLFARLDPFPRPTPVIDEPPLTVQRVRRLRRAPHLSVENIDLFHSAFELDLEPGMGLKTGQGSNPQLIMRMSRTGGKTWGNERWVTAGPQGKYTTRARWLSNGRGRDIVYEVVCSDPVKIVLLDAYLMIVKART
jgi:hypothetical protein